MNVKLDEFTISLASCCLNRLTMMIESPSAASFIQVTAAPLCLRTQRVSLSLPAQVILTTAVDPAVFESDLIRISQFDVKGQ
jgi:uncharacterized membrane protein